MQMFEVVAITQFESDQMVARVSSREEAEKIVEQMNHIPVEDRIGMWDDVTVREAIPFVPFNIEDWRW